MWLVRHGAIDTLDPDTGTRRLVGWTDEPLADPSHTAALMRRLARRVGEADLVWSSDSSRALETARLLAGEIGARVRVDARLRELHFGNWEDSTWPAVERDAPQAYWAFMNDWERAATPGGESYAAVRARVGGWLAEHGEARVVVAHHGSLRALSSWLGGGGMSESWAYGEGRWTPVLTPSS